jgi:2-amino-4-hydroxy-6-hydroxymethyldihydropteridine diphosphokinase
MVEKQQLAAISAMPTVYLSLGSNLGDRETNLSEAIRRLDGPDLKVTAVSTIYETTPVGETEEPVPDYLNCVVRAETNLSPEALLNRTQAVEQAGARQPTFRWGPRTIDVDILWYEGVEMTSDWLTLPHPRLMERAFVLVPLAEIAPDLRLRNGQTVSTALKSNDLRDQIVCEWNPPGD